MHMPSMTRYFCNKNRKEAMDFSYDSERRDRVWVIFMIM